MWVLPHRLEALKKSHNMIVYIVLQGHGVQTFVGHLVCLLYRYDLFINLLIKSMEWAEHATRNGEFSSVRHTFRTLQIALNLCQLTSFWTFNRPIRSDSTSTSTWIRKHVRIQARVVNEWVNNRGESGWRVHSPTFTALRNKLELQLTTTTLRRQRLRLSCPLHRRSGG